MLDLISNDQPNACPFDGARTNLIAQMVTYSVECCPECGHMFKFHNDEEVEE